MSMTIDEMIEVLQGFKDGRKVEYYDHSVWYIVIAPIFNFFNYDYRLAPERKIVPYGQKDGAWLVLRKFKVKETATYGFITTAGGGGVSLSINDFDHSGVSWKNLLEYYLDVTDSIAGVPFGRVEK